ncbi:unnamed protein product [Chrysodeixis includens]|uniref:Uncharacterized protein n=1 Tax=Chrysodeixis includens TaxID=689277 RepID=A0A9N8L0T2_CHRIL|nr:unnamed protein product [Chrysodeixis includens]
MLRDCRSTVICPGTVRHDLLRRVGPDPQQPGVHAARPVVPAFVPLVGEQCGGEFVPLGVSVELQHVRVEAAAGVLGRLPVRRVRRHVVTARAHAHELRHARLWFSFDAGDEDVHGVLYLAQALLHVVGAVGELLDGAEQVQRGVRHLLRRLLVLVHAIHARRRRRIVHRDRGTRMTGLEFVLVWVRRSVDDLADGGRRVLPLIVGP